MSPASELAPPVPVVTVTLAPPVKAAVIRSTPSDAPSLVDTKGLAALILVLPPPATIVMLFGSISQLPPNPSALRAKTCGVPVMVSAPWLDVSTKPPLPPSMPPRADKPPAMTELSRENTAMLPPSPLPVASALSDASGPMYVRAATARPSPPRTPPPMRMAPPPRRPEASTVPPVTITSWSDSNSMRPPWSPVAVTLPLLCTLPPLPTSRTTPPSVLIPLASITPELLTRLVNRSLAAEACSTTVPPSALRVPELLTAASLSSRRCFSSPVIWMLIRPLPSKSSTACSAPSRLMLP